MSQSTIAQPTNAERSEWGRLVETKKAQAKTRDEAVRAALADRPDLYPAATIHEGERVRALAKMARPSGHTLDDVDLSVIAKSVDGMTPDEMSSYFAANPGVWENYRKVQLERSKRR